MRSGLFWCALLVSLRSTPSLLHAQEAQPAQQEPAQASSGETEWPKPQWLMSEEQATQFGKRDKILVADKAKRAPQPGSAERDQLQKIVSYYLSLLTFPSDKNLPKDVTEKLLGPTEILSQLTTDAARTFMLEDIVRKAPDLLTHPSKTVRLNAALMLGQLSIEPADLAKRTPAVPYTPAYKVLAQVVQDSNQYAGARIAAARGLARICSDADPIASERQDMGTALVAALNQVPVEANDGTVILRCACACAIGRVGLIGTAADQSLMIDKLMAMMTNPKEHWLSRSEASLALSRLQMTPSVNLPLIVHETCKYVQEMNGAYAKRQGSGYWRRAYGLVYLSFRPGTPEQAQRSEGWLYQTRRPGLSNHQAYIGNAFQILFPVLEPVFNNIPSKPVPAEAQKALRKFIDENPPTSRSVTPTSEPLGNSASQSGDSKI